MKDDGDPCISDFGLAKVLHNGALSKMSDWPAYNTWTPPEYFGEVEDGSEPGMMPTTEGDVYSFGATVMVNYHTILHK